MSFDKNIEHEGIVRKRCGGQVTVEIVSKSACSGCSARSLCSSSEQKTKEIEIQTGNGEEYEIGERVTVVGQESLGMIAVVICYVLPVILMVTIMAALTNMGKPDTTVGLAGIGVLIPYFGVVYMMRNKMRKHFRFKIKR